MSEVYKVMVAIGMTNGISPVLSIIGKDLLGLNSKVGEVEKSFGKWAIAIGGVASVLGGTAILGGLTDIAKHGINLLDQQDKLRRAGLSQVEVANLTADAYERVTKAVPTATAVDVLRTTNELRMVTGSIAEAEKASTKSLQLEALVGNATGKSAEGQGYNVWRALEMKGVSMDEAKTDEVMGKLTAMIIGSGGKITGSEIKNFAQQAGPAWQLLNEHAMGGSMPYMINEMGGDRAGTGWNRMYNTIMGTRRWTKQQYSAWESLGLIDSSKVLSTDKMGMHNFAPGGPIKGGMENVGDLGDFVSRVLKPAFDAKGITDPTVVNGMIAKLFPDSTAARLAARIYQQLANIEKDRINLGAAHPLGQAYGDLVKDNPKGVIEAFEKQKESMLEAMGGPLMKAAIPVMQSVTEMFNKMGAMANAHPEAVKYIGETLAALGVGLVAIGGIALASLVSMPVAIAGAVAAISSLIALNWDGLKSMVNSVVEYLASIPGRLKGLFPEMGWGPERDASGHIKKPGMLDKWLWGEPGDAVKQNQRYDGSTDAPRLIPTRFDPGANRQRRQQFAFSLNVDGRKLAETIAQQIMAMSTYQTDSAASNGSEFYGA